MTINLIWEAILLFLLYRQAICLATIKWLMNPMSKFESDVASLKIHFNFQLFNKRRRSSLTLSIFLNKHSNQILWRKRDNRSWLSTQRDKVIKVHNILLSLFLRWMSSKLSVEWMLQNLKDQYNKSANSFFLYLGLRLIRALITLIIVLALLAL